MNILLLAIVVPTIAAYVCRLNYLRVLHHSPMVILLHISLAMSSGWAGYHAYLGIWGLQDIACASAAALWIAVSYRTWKDGVPDHFKTERITFPQIKEEDFQKISGGKGN